MKNKKYPTGETFPESNKKFVARDKIDTNKYTIKNPDTVGFFYFRG